MSAEHATRGGTVLGVVIAFVIIAVLFTVLRYLTRILIVRNFGPEDWAIGFATIFSIAMSVCMGEQVRYGLGQHFETLGHDVYQSSLKPFWASIWLYNLSLTMTKVSILFQYYRIFVYEKTRIAIWVTMGVVVCYGIATFFDSLFICLPISEVWSANRNKANNACVNENLVWYANAVINIVLDIVIVVLPMPAVRSLDISTGRKIAAMSLFALGGFVTLTSCIRLYSIHQVADSEDVTWDNVSAAVWSCVETNVGIACACLPATRPLFAYLRGRRNVPESSPYHLSQHPHEFPSGQGTLETPIPAHRSTFSNRGSDANAPQSDDSRTSSTPGRPRKSSVVSGTRSDLT